MNILIVCHYGLYQNPSSSFVHAQAAAYAALGHRVRVLIPLPQGKADRKGRRLSLCSTISVVDQVELYDLRFLSLSNFGAKIGWNTFAAKQVIKMHWKQVMSDFTPDIIHAHTLGFDSEIGAWFKARLHVPLVVTTHGSDTSIPYEQGQLSWLAEEAAPANHVAAVSSALAKKLADSGTKTSISVILNGFRIQALPATAERKPYSVIQVGHLIAQKHFDTTLRAFARLKETQPAACLTIVGHGSEQKALEQLAQELGVSDAVRFTGELSNEDVLAEMSRAQFFCMPSVREGFGIVYLEAMAAGCITIGTEDEGIADLIESGKNGFLVPPESPDAIVRVMAWCLAHPQEAAAIARRGNQDAMVLTWEGNAKKYLELFRTLLEGEKKQT